MSGGTGVNTGRMAVGAGERAPRRLGKDRGYASTRFRSSGRCRPCGRSPTRSDGPAWVVAQAEAELVARYGFLDDGELGLTAAMFDPPAGVFLVARSAGRAAAGRRASGLRSVGDRARARSSRLWVDPAGVAAASAACPHGGARGRRMRPRLPALWLETGDRQPEAVALYDGDGWSAARSRPTEHRSRLARSASARSSADRPDQDAGSGLKDGSVASCPR